MHRWLLIMSVMSCVLAPTLSAAADLTGRTGLGFESGLMKLVGGDFDYSNLDQHLTLHLRRGLSPHWSLELSLKYGWVRPGVERPGDEARWATGSGSGLYTVIWQPRIGVLYNLAPQARFAPLCGLSLGSTSWRVRNERGRGNPGLFPSGPLIEGYDEAGNLQSLQGENFTVTVLLGSEYFVSRSVVVSLGARYHLMLGNDVDNIGFSQAWGPIHVDANTGLVEGYVGLTYFFGSNDNDNDGIKNRKDACPDDAEDFDGFEDTDGCPDPDNDQDGIPDLADACPHQPEDRDGFADADGCPDPDNDGDGVHDAADRCPNEPEDLDGFADQDGCPDPDNDGDGVLDGDDSCPDTPAGNEVDAQGCSIVPEVPRIAEKLILEGVNFLSSSAQLTSTSVIVLAEVARSLLAYPDALIEVRGHTDAVGPAEANRDLSHRRAMAVRDALIQLGVAPSRITAVGYGEDYPLAPNDIPEGRARNRRVEIHRIDH